MELFSAKNVTKNYAAHRALSDVSISVPEGSIFGLLGPNGAGKTTLIRIINQITAPDSGQLFFEGRPMVSDDIYKIGYLPEERGLYKKMKVGEQALYLAQLKGMSKTEALRGLKEWFEKFDILPWWDKKVMELSKGMQQKIQFICTVLHKPKLLIFDEPFSGFDPINAELLKREILALKEEGATIIFSTHNMESVEELCDNIALINKSEKILDGPTQQIREKFKSNTFEVGYKGEFSQLNDVLTQGYEIENNTVGNNMQTMRVKFQNGTTSNDLLQMLIKQVDIVSFNEVIPSMNDVFINVVTNHTK